MNRKKPQLQSVRKGFLVNYYNDFPQATIGEALGCLTEHFEEPKIKRSTVGYLVLHDCNLTMKRIAVLLKQEII